MASPAEEDRFDLYLMDLTSDGHRLAEAVSTYRDDQTYFIHFPSFLKAVEFSIERNGRVWTGWYRSEENRFRWDEDGNDAGPREGMAQDVRPSAFETAEGTFVPIEALEAWFDLELTPDPRTQIVVIVSRDPLPFQAREARANARKRHHPAADDEADMHVPDQYRWATKPLFDFSSQYRLQSDDGETHSDAQAALTMGLDLLKHSMLYSGSTGSENGHQRLTIQRRAPVADGNLALGIESYIAGDIVDDRSSLVNGGGNGAGFSIQRRSDAGSGSQSRATITGDGPPGWEAELYRNNVLVAFGSVSDDGRYVFPDQETVYGENVFLVKLFGPQGQVSEHRQSYWSGGVDLEKGDHSFRVSHVDFTERFIDDDPKSTSSLPSLKTTDIHYARAVATDLQIGAGYTRAELGSRLSDGTFSDSEYATVDGRMNVGKGLLMAERVQQRDRGDAWSLRYVTGLRGHNISLSREEFHDFESPYTLRGTEIDAQSQITLSGPLHLAGLNSYTLRFTRRERADGLSDFRMFNRIGAHWGAMYLGNDFDYLRVSSGDDFLLGRLRVTGRWNRLSVRTQLDYDPAAADPLSQLSAMLRWNASKNTYYSISAHKNLKNDRVLRVENMVTTRIANLDLSVALDSSSDDFWAMRISLGTRFGTDSDAGIFAEGSLANTGRATLNFFLDRNNNGVRDVDEPPVDWAAYKDQETPTTDDGVIKLASLPAHVPLRIESRHFRFNDPFLLPGRSAYELYTHPGGNLEADIPVLMTGDVEGNLHPVPGRDSNVSGLRVLLLDPAGELVAESHSEFDGYYSFRSIPVGDYEVVVDASIRKIEVHEQSFSLDADEGFVRLAPMLIYGN